MQRITQRTRHNTQPKLKIQNIRTAKGTQVTQQAYTQESAPIFVQAAQLIDQYRPRTRRHKTPLAYTISITVRRHEKAYAMQA